MNVDRALQGIAVFTARRVRQFLARKRAARMTRECPQEAKLGRRQGKFGAGPMQPVQFNSVGRNGIKIVTQI